MSTNPPPEVKISLGDILGPPNQLRLSPSQWSLYLENTFLSQHDLREKKFSIFGEMIQKKICQNDEIKNVAKKRLNSSLLSLLIAKKYPQGYIMILIQHINTLIDINNPYHCIPSSILSLSARLFIIFSAEMRPNYPTFFEEKNKNADLPPDFLAQNLLSKNSKDVTTIYTNATAKTTILNAYPSDLQDNITSLVNMVSSALSTSLLLRTSPHDHPINSALLVLLSKLQFYLSHTKTVLNRPLNQNVGFLSSPTTGADILSHRITFNAIENEKKELLHFLGDFTNVSAPNRSSRQGPNNPSSIPSAISNTIQERFCNNSFHHIPSHVAKWWFANQFLPMENIEITKHGREFFSLFSNLFFQHTIKQCWDGLAAWAEGIEKHEYAVSNCSYHRDSTATMANTGGQRLGGNLIKDNNRFDIQNRGKEIDFKIDFKIDQNNDPENIQNSPQIDKMSNFFENPYQYPYLLSKVFAATTSTQKTLENSFKTNSLSSLVAFFVKTITHYYGNCPFSRIVLDNLIIPPNYLSVSGKMYFDSLISFLKNYFVDLQRTGEEISMYLRNGDQAALQKRVDAIPPASGFTIDKKTGEMTTSTQTNHVTIFSSQYFLRSQHDAYRISTVFELILNSFLQSPPDCGQNYAKIIIYVLISQIPQNDPFIFPYFFDYFPNYPLKIFSQKFNSEIINKGVTLGIDDSFIHEMEIFQQGLEENNQDEDQIDQIDKKNAKKTTTNTTKQSPSETNYQIISDVLTSISDFKLTNGYELILTNFDSFFLTALQFSADFFSYPQQFSQSYQNFKSEFHYLLSTFPDYPSQLSYLESLLVEDQITHVESHIAPVVDKHGQLDIWGVLTDNDQEARVANYEKNLKNIEKITQEEGTVRVTQQMIDRFKVGVKHYNKCSSYSVLHYLLSQQDIYDIDLLFFLLQNTNQHELYLMNRPYDFNTLPNSGIRGGLGMVRKDGDKAIVDKGIGGKNGRNNRNNRNNQDNQDNQNNQNNNQSLISKSELNPRHNQPSFEVNIGGRYLISLMIERQYPTHILNLYLRICEDNIFNVENNTFYSPKKIQIFQKIREEKIQFSPQNNTDFETFYNLEDALSLTILDYALIHHTYYNHIDVVTPVLAQSPSLRSDQPSGASSFASVYNTEGLDFTKYLIRRTNCAYIRPPIRSISDPFHNPRDKLVVKRTQNKIQKDEKDEKDEINISFELPSMASVRPDERYIHRFLSTINYDQDISGDLLQYLAKKTIFDNHNLFNLEIEIQFDKFIKLKNQYFQNANFCQRIDSHLEALTNLKISSRYTEPNYDLDKDQNDIDLIETDIITWPYLHYLLNNFPALYQTKENQAFFFILIETFLTRFLTKSSKIPQPISQDDFSHSYNARNYVYTNKDLVLNQYDVIYLVYFLISISFSPTFIELILSSFFSQDYLYQFYYFYLLPLTPKNTIGNAEDSNLDGSNPETDNESFNLTRFDPKYHFHVQIEAQDTYFYAPMYKYSYFPLFLKNTTVIPNITQNLGLSDISDYQFESNREFIGSTPPLESQNLNEAKKNQKQIDLHLTNEALVSAYTTLVKPPQTRSLFGSHPPSWAVLNHDSISQKPDMDLYLGDGQISVISYADNITITYPQNKISISDKYYPNYDPKDEDQDPLGLGGIDAVGYNISPTIVDHIFHSNTLLQPAYLTLLYKYCHLDKMVTLNQVTPSLFHIGNTYLLSFFMNFLSNIMSQKRLPNLDTLLNHVDVYTSNSLISLDNKNYIQCGLSLLENLIPILFLSPPTPPNPSQLPPHITKFHQIDQRDTLNVLNIARVSIPALVLYGHYICDAIPISLFLTCCVPSSNLNANLPMPFNPTRSAYDNWLCAAKGEHPYGINNEEMVKKKEGIKKREIPTHTSYWLPQSVYYNNQSNYYPKRQSHFAKDDMNWFIHDYDPNVVKLSKLSEQSELYPISKVEKIGVKNCGNDNQIDKDDFDQTCFVQNKFPTLPVMNMIHYMVFEAIWHANIPKKVKSQQENDKIENHEKNKQKNQPKNQSDQNKSENELFFEETEAALFNMLPTPLYKSKHLIDDIIIPFVSLTGKKRTDGNIEKKIGQSYQQNGANNCKKNENHVLMLNQLVSPTRFLTPEYFFRPPIKGFYGPHSYDIETYLPNLPIVGSYHFSVDENHSNNNNNKKQNYKKHKNQPNKSQQNQDSDNDSDIPSPTFFRSLPEISTSTLGSNHSSSTPTQAHSPFNHAPFNPQKYLISLHLWNILLSGTTNVSLDLITFLTQFGLEFVYSYNNFPAYIQAQIFGLYLQKAELYQNYTFVSRSCESYAEDRKEHVNLIQKFIPILEKEEEKNPTGSTLLLSANVSANPNAKKKAKKIVSNKKNHKSTSKSAKVSTPVDTSLVGARNRLSNETLRHFEAQRQFLRRVALSEAQYVPVYHNFITMAMLQGYPFVRNLIELSKQYPLRVPLLPQFENGFEKTQLWKENVIKNSKLNNRQVITNIDVIRGTGQINQFNHDCNTSSDQDQKNPEYSTLLNHNNNNNNTGNSLGSIKMVLCDPINLRGFDSLFYKFRISLHTFLSKFSLMSQYTPHFATQHEKYMSPAEIPCIARSMTEESIKKRYFSGNDSRVIRYSNRYIVSARVLDNSVEYYRQYKMLEAQYGLVVSSHGLDAKLHSITGIKKPAKWGNKHNPIANNGQNDKNMLINSAIDTMKKNSNRDIAGSFNKIAKIAKKSANNQKLGLNDVKKKKNIQSGSVSSYLIGTEYESDDGQDEDDYYDDDDDEDDYYYDDDDDDEDEDDYSYLYKDENVQKGAKNNQDNSDDFDVFFGEGEEGDFLEDYFGQGEFDADTFQAELFGGDIHIAPSD